MLMGVREEFAVECIHEPDYPNDHGHVFGRMCVWCCGVQLGNLDAPACMLNVTEGFFQDGIGRLQELYDDAINNLTDEEAFRFLDAAIYLDDDSSNQDVYADWLRFSKFIFLTNWGESFDGTKAFLVKSGQVFRVLYRLHSGTTGSGTIPSEALLGAMLAFLEWMVIEKRKVPSPNQANRSVK